LSETEFIHLLRRRDEQAFQQLIVEQRSRVFNTCFNILQSIEDGEDVCQDVVIEIFQSISKFKGDSQLSTWIYRIAITKSLEFLRKKNRKKRFGFFQSLTGQGDYELNQPANFDHPGIQLENKELSRILFAAIEKLPERQKVAFLLHKTENLSYADIAEVMEISVSSVESLLFRAKQGLQKILNTYYENNFK